MPPQHSLLSGDQLASSLGLDIESIQVDVVLQAANGWLALVPIGSFHDSPDCVRAKLNRPAWDSRPWWKKVTNGTKRWPPESWMVAAEVETGSWIWLGSASCHSWSRGREGEPVEGDLALENRLPRELFLNLRNGDPWIDCGGGLELHGSFDTPASERLRLIIQKDKGDVFLQRWAGDIFGLQFDDKRSVFFVMPEGLRSMVCHYGSCPGAAYPPETDAARIVMHCTCCGIEIGAFLPELHMSREFGFFVLSWLLDHNELPLFWPESGQHAIEWHETDTLSGV